MVEKLWGAVGHAAIVLGAAFVVLLILDLYNPMMEYLTGLTGRVFLGVFCLCAIANGVLTVRHLLRRGLGKDTEPSA